MFRSAIYDDGHDYQSFRAGSEEEREPLLHDFDQLQGLFDEPLLEPVEDQAELNEVVVEVHPDDINISRPQNRPPVKFLEMQIDECLEIINRAIVQVPAARKQHKDQHYSVVTLFSFIMLGGVLLQALPITAFKIALDQLTELLKPARDKFTQALAERDHAWQALDGIYASYDALVGGLYNDFYAYSPGHRSCVSMFWYAVGDMSTWEQTVSPFPAVPYGIFCQMNETLAVTDVYDSAHAYCEPITREICHLINDFHQYGNTVAECAETIVAAREHIKIANEVLKEAADHLAALDNRHDYPAYNFAIGVAVVTSLIAAAALILGVNRIRNSRRQYSGAVQSADEVLHAIADPVELNKVINIADRLGINLAGMRLADLKADLETEKVRIVADWRRRIGFLGGRLRSEASSHDFFKSRGSRDVEQMILRDAGMVPGRSKRL